MKPLVIRAAIAEMEKAEPVAWLITAPDGYTTILRGPTSVPDHTNTPLYAHPAPAIPEGWQLVPKSTTCDMDSAGSKAHYKNWDGSPTVTESDAESIYKAMLAAAPEYKP